ncbi:3013_t:CDS:2 [Dentiscutata heterogama]|uniref:3013_t:CDS:1 n=1 Tax=Dentiscutata heterogama TaxID=1316150 RepID=A0ACA9M2X1_9GLOM|nr:3013_t:CDS:2 [Dentiscutata heterogama]
MQLQCALDLDEAEKHDIYKVDQLQAMRWVAWNEISANTIKNCWFHTKIISPHDEDGVLVVPPPPSPLIEDVEESLFVDPDDELATMKLQQTIDALCTRNPMPIKALLDLEEEKTDIHQQFNDDDFVQAATEIDHVENEVIIQPLTRQEQLKILCNALQIIDEKIDDSGITMKALRKLQTCIREEI